MPDRPIIFSAPMVRALLDGRKTQTRRLLPKAHPRCPHHNQIRMDVLTYDPQRPEVWYWDGKHDRVGASHPIPYAPGDRLYVREAWQAHGWASDCVTIRYRAEERTAGFTKQIEQIRYPDGDRNAFKYVAPKGPDFWRPSIHMPRWASRLTLTVTDVRVQRLQEISEADAVAEGVGIPRTHDLDCGPMSGVESVVDGIFCADHRDAMQHTWQILHGPGAWAANPWVVALTFTVQRGNIDHIGGAA